MQTGVASIALLLVAIVYSSQSGNCSATTLAEPASDDSAGADQRQNKFQALFEWRHYFQRFSKKYSSQLEATRRRFYVMANAMRVYTTGLAFMKRKSSHYLALNHLSDRSPDELGRMLNAVMADSGQANSRAPTAPVDASLQDNSQLVLASDDGIERWGKFRAKRETETGADRELTVEMLIQDTGAVPEPLEALAKIEGGAPLESNGSDYKPPPAETTAGGTKSLVEQQEKLKAWRLAVESNEAIATPNRSPLDHVKGFLSGLGQNLLANKHKLDGERLPDEMFLDLSQSGCMLNPRDQGIECGACYAFAGVSMAEYLFCRDKGKLYAFSEQYLIDCGRNRVGRMGGCSGALHMDLPTFVHNYGLELRDRYPYAGRETNNCPYSNHSNLKATGYIRMQLGDYLFVPVRAWPQVLELSPIFVGLAAPAHFAQYGGGVDSGRRCARESNHAVLVVGHGREDGQEFWLVRNSFGVHWGQKGYYKLAKSAPKRCLDKQMGLVWGTRNARDFNIEIALNELNVEVKRRPVPDLNKLFELSDAA